MAVILGLAIPRRTYPEGDPLRDAAHARLLQRLYVRLHPSLRWQTEVPLPNPGDRRAWDAIVEGAAWRTPIEAETVVDDAQALERRLALKLGDGGFDQMILLVADTRRNRAALAAAPAAFARFDNAARDILSALAAGKDPGSSGIVIL